MIHFINVKKKSILVFPSFDVDGLIFEDRFNYWSFCFPWTYVQQCYVLSKNYIQLPEMQRAEITVFKQIKYLFSHMTWGPRV